MLLYVIVGDLFTIIINYKIETTFIFLINF